MTITIEVPQKSINDAVLSAELEAAAPEAVAGFSQGKAWPGLVRLHFADGTPQAVIDAALAAYAAHNPAVLSPAQELAARRAAAQGDVSNADFLSVLNAINDASTLAAAKPIMRQLLRLIYRVALAQGLTDASDPES